MPIIA